MDRLEGICSLDESERAKIIQELVDKECVMMKKEEQLRQDIKELNRIVMFLVVFNIIALGCAIQFGWELLK